MPLLEQVTQSILAGNGLQTQDVDRVMAALLSAPVDAADIYFQSSHFESWSMEGGIIKEGSHSIEHGAGVRVVSGDKTGFAYSDRIELPILLEAANNVKAMSDTVSRRGARSKSPRVGRSYTNRLIR